MSRFDLQAEMQRTEFNKSKAFELVKTVLADPAKKEAAEAAQADYSNIVVQTLSATELATAKNPNDLGRGVEYQLWGAFTEALNTGKEISAEKVSPEVVRSLVSASYTTGAGASI